MSEEPIEIWYVDFEELDVTCLEVVRDKEGDFYWAQDEVGSYCLLSEEVAQTELEGIDKLLDYICGLMGKLHTRYEELEVRKQELLNE